MDDFTYIPVSEKQSKECDDLRIGLVHKIVLEDFKKIHSEEKYGWIDTMLMSLVLQVVLKYFVKWLIDNFTIENKDT